MSDDRELVDIADVADALDLPISWLKREANEGRLPHLKVGAQRRFNIAAVKRVLFERAQEVPAETLVT